MMRFKRLAAYGLAFGVAVVAAVSFFPKNKPLLSRMLDLDFGRKTYAGTITDEYLGGLPVPENHPWAKCSEYRFEIRTQNGVQGFSILDFEDPMLRARLIDIDRRFNVGDMVEVTPTGAVFSTSLDRIVKPEDLEKVTD